HIQPFPTRRSSDLPAETGRNSRTQTHARSPTKPAGSRATSPSAPRTTTSARPNRARCRCGGRVYAIRGSPRILLPKLGIDALDDLKGLLGCEHRGLQLPSVYQRGIRVAPQRLQPRLPEPLLAGLHGLDGDIEVAA